MSEPKKILLGLNIVCVLAMIAYLVLFGYSLSPYWFHQDWVTDDSFQQIYPFLKVHQPELFAGDLITDVMEGYLAPAHYWLAYGITYLTGSPIMMSHWMMLLQVGLSVTFLFCFVKKIADLPSACLATIWFVNTRTLIQRMTGGLPRGWAPVIICGFLYFLSRRNHYAVLVLLLIGCLLNPPATIVVALTYGIFLFVNLFTKEREIFIKPFIVLLLLSPLYVFVTAQVVKRPESVGQMVTYEQALKLPEMQRPDGRFPFAPLLDLPTELKLYAFDAFKHRLSNGFAWQREYWIGSVKFFKDNGAFFFLQIFNLILIIALIKRKSAVGLELLCYFSGIVIVYLLSRLLAFNLYVPDRHLLIPLGIFWITAFSSLITRTFAKQIGDTFQQTKTSLCLLILLGFLIALSNGHGMYGTANFNYSLYKKGKVFSWIRKNTRPEVLIAGHPQHLDALMLFGERKGYITYETSHPFYSKYFTECLRRNEISLNAHYAKTLQEVYDLLAPEKIDYFVFDRKRFYPEKLANEKYFAPLNLMVKELTSRDYQDYAFKKIPREVNAAQFPYLVFRDDFSVMIDVAKLGQYLKTIQLEQNAKI